MLGAARSFAAGSTLLPEAVAELLLDAGVVVVVVSAAVVCWPVSGAVSLVGGGDGVVSAVVVVVAGDVDVEPGKSPGALLVPPFDAASPLTLAASLAFFSSAARIPSGATGGKVCVCVCVCVCVPVRGWIRA